MYDGKFHIGYNVFKDVDKIKGKGFIHNALIHSSFAEIALIFDTYTFNKDIDQEMISNRYDMFVEILKKQTRNRLAKMLLEYIEEIDQA